MADQILPLADGFWNIRGTFRVAGGLINAGTQSSLVRLGSGRFVLLDAYTLRGKILSKILGLTDGGRAIEAILHLHPFHTLHARAVHAQLPHARLYGTVRHRTRMPDLPWDALGTEDESLHEQFSADLDFSIPAGVDFVPSNENLHFASVIAHHRPSGTLHVDDTLLYMNLPFARGLRFHPTLKQVLQPVPGAVDSFRSWAQSLIKRCNDVSQVATAHGAAPYRPRRGMRVAEEVQRALDRVEGVLKAHKDRYG